MLPDATPQPALQSVHYGYFPWRFDDPVPRYVPVEYRVKWATLQWEEQQAYQLRRAVFCAEQGIFEVDDRDELDFSGEQNASSELDGKSSSNTRAQLLVALSCQAGMPEQVVGTVRIHEDAPGVWLGSRLAVHGDFRSQGKLGATLIKLAVSSAHALGCHTFLAHVQSQNVPLFRRMHWQVLREETLLGRPHHLMQATLAKYPPCLTPTSGFVIQSRPAA